MKGIRLSKLIGLLMIGAIAGCGSSGTEHVISVPTKVMTHPATSRAATLYEKLQAYPVMVGVFMKVGVTRYDDPAGEDVSVGYNFFRGLMYTSIAYTAYFYPLPDAGTPTAFEKHRAYLLRVMTTAHPDARIVSSGKTVVRQRGEDYEGVKIIFTYREPFGGKGQTQELQSELYLFQRGSQAVKYRITYPTKESVEAADRISHFLADFTWPES